MRVSLALIAAAAAYIAITYLKLTCRRRRGKEAERFIQDVERAPVG